eukprot:3803314-Amphidinium_carterae.1
MRASKKDLPLGKGLLNNTSRNKEQNLQFAGDIEGRIEDFEREILRYKHASGESVSDALRIGI